MNISKENLLNIANVIVGSSCDTADEIAAIIELGLCAETNDRTCGIRKTAEEVMQEMGSDTTDTWAVASISGIIARRCVSQETVADLITAARKDEASNWVRKLAETTEENICLAANIKSLELQLDAAAKTSEEHRGNVVLSQREIIAVRQRLQSAYQEYEAQRIANTVLRKDVCVLRSQLAEVGGPDARIEELIKKCQEKNRRIEELQFNGAVGNAERSTLCLNIKELREASRVSRAETQALKGQLDLANTTIQNIQNLLVKS